MDALELLARSPIPDLLAALPSLSPKEASQVVFGCLRAERWEALEALRDSGFDLSANYTEELATETLLHRAVRVHKYENLEGKVERLLDLGVDPHRENAQGLTVLGLLCMQSQDIPPHHTQATLEALLGHGVRLTDSCGKGEMARYLLVAHSAPEILGKRCPELVPWVQSVLLNDWTPRIAASPSRPRL